MKTLKIALIATLVTVLLIVLCGSALAEVGDRGEFYPRLSVVIGWENVGNLTTVICVDKDGNEWSFYADHGEYQIGDLVNLLMWNLGGEHEEEDEIIEVYYEGRLSVAQMLDWFRMWDDV